MFTHVDTVPAIGVDAGAGIVGGPANRPHILALAFALRRVRYIGRWHRTSQRDSARNVVAERYEQLAGLRTRLDAFNEREQCELIHFGYAVSDNYLRRTFCPDAEPPRSLPYPAYP